MTQHASDIVIPFVNKNGPHTKAPPESGKGDDGSLEQEWSVIQKVLQGLADLLKQLKRHDINFLQLDVLLLVARKPPEGLTAGEIARELGLSTSTLSTAIFHLGPRKRTGDPGLGLVEIGFDAIDSRRHRVRVTARGHTVIRQIAKTVAGR